MISTHPILYNTIKSTMCSLTDHVVEGILKYSLAPYADQNNIELSDLIKKLSDYHSENMIEKKPKKKLKINTKRGRPAGSTNDKSNTKKKKSDNNGGSVDVVKRPRGRPKGSTNKKHNDVDVGI